MGLISVLWGVVAMIWMVFALIPVIGITNWLLIPFAAIGAIMGVSLVTYGIATVVFGVLDKATIQRLMRRQS